ncbi:O-antigen ligase family protein [Roseateles amylovorans]|uniref:O-antigen ligase family protein n=1 Tax=Roseateles amylovorans TaxID=2978473 RepID=A0ABY6B4J5_9BURK|nr:O-antigen ligase family protein [Roseateles amylovorans]UXH78185.1 O-antigen ligase family protein [Roseateles amylovorans]
MPYLTCIVAVAIWLIPVLHSVMPGYWSAHDFSRLSQLVLLTAAVPFCLQSASIRYPNQVVDRVGFAAFSMCVMTSVGMSYIPAIAIREVILFAALFTLSCAMAREMARVGCERPLQIMALGTLIYGLHVVGMAIVVLANGQPIAGWELLTGFDNPRFLNHAQTIAIPLAAAVSLQPNTRRLMRTIALGATFLSGALLFICQGRATIVAIAVGICVVIALFRGTAVRRYAVALSVPLLLGGLSMALLFQFAPETVGGVGSDGFTKVHSRDFLILRAMDIAIDSPWFGVGPMHYAHAYNGKASHPHNFYIQLLAEVGIPATLISAVLVARWMRRCYRTLRRVSGDLQPLAAGVWTAFTAVLVDGLFSGNFVMPISQLWIAVLLGIIMGMLGGGANSESDHSFPSPRLAIARRPVVLLVFAATGWLALQAFSEAAGVDAPTLHGASEAFKTYIAPRFWSHGWF